MDVDALRTAITELTPESDVATCLQIEAGINNVTDPKVQAELMDLYEKHNAIADTAVEQAADDDDDDDDDDDGDVDLAEDDGEDTFDHDKFG